MGGEGSVVVPLIVADDIVIRDEDEDRRTKSIYPCNLRLVGIKTPADTSET